MGGWSRKGLTTYPNGLGICRWLGGNENGTINIYSEWSGYIFAGVILNVQCYGVKELTETLFFPIYTWPLDIQLLFTNTPINDTDTFKFILFMYGNNAPPDLTGRLFHLSILYTFFYFTLVTCPLILITLLILNWPNYVTFVFIYHHNIFLKKDIKFKNPLTETLFFHIYLATRHSVSIH